jgi:hypothetical protein
MRSGEARPWGYVVTITNFVPTRIPDLFILKNKLNFKALELKGYGISKE